MKTNHGILILVLASSPAFGQQGNDPWAQVPALPTACYSSDDGFQDAAYAASEALGTEKSQLEETNDAMAQQLRDLDPTEQQQRMMTFMMEHPEDAQRYMQAVQQGGQQAQEQTIQMAERQLQFDSDLNELTSNYDAALSKTMVPINERRQRLTETDCTEGRTAKEVALIGEENAAYSNLCAQWWKEGSAFHAWLAEFKQYQIEIAAENDEMANTAVLNYEVMGIAADGYRPTGYLNAPIEYLRRANQVFSKRRYGPVSDDIGSCGDHG